jgi:hypothetical protein
MAEFVIDRFESVWVVLESEAPEAFRIPRSWVPASAKEGDVLRMEPDSLRSPSSVSLQISIDAEATDARRREATERRHKLPRGPKGDISL